MYTCYFVNHTTGELCAMDVRSDSISKALLQFHRVVRAKGSLSKGDRYKETACIGPRDQSDFPVYLFMSGNMKKAR